MSRARLGGRPVMAVGAHVVYRGRTWQVVALSGQQAHLAGEHGSNERVLFGHLFADPEFAVLGVERPQAAPKWGLFTTAPAGQQERARAWQRHIREVECGLPEGPGRAGCRGSSTTPGGGRSRNASRPRPTN